MKETPIFADTRHLSEVTDTVYQNGDAIDGAGAAMSADAFPLRQSAPQTENAILLTAHAFEEMYRIGGAEAGRAYQITDDAPVCFTVSRTYDFAGVTLIAPAGLILSGLVHANLRNLTVLGPVTLRACRDLKISRFALFAPNGTALTATADSSDICLRECRLSGTVSVASAADNLALNECALHAAETCVLDTAARGTTLRGSCLTGAKVGLSTAATGFYIRENSFALATDSVAITIGAGALNGLVALNEITGAQKSISLCGATNVLVILNSAVTVELVGNTSVYVCENALGGRIRAESNRYLIADGNTFLADGLDHATLCADNENVNGDSLTDVDARPAAGADEALLPHVNKDLHLGMERLETVREGAYDTGLSAKEYIEKLAAAGTRVILAPGLYASQDTIVLGAAHSDTTVYGYGALIERDVTAAMNIGGHISIDGAHAITFKGLTIGYERQSCGQVYVLEKMADNKLLLVTGAGMVNEFGTTNPMFKIATMGAQHENTFYAYCDTWFMSIEKREDGLMEMTVDPNVYARLAKGDILTCRSFPFSTTVAINSSTDIVFRDFTNYGNSGGYAFVEGNNRTATTYYRLANLTKNGPIIDRATYDRYAALQEEHGVNLEISVDALGRLRGSLPHIGSIDATHVAGCAAGSHATSCIFENMCDDATNQRHSHSRVDEINDNGDGTTTIVFKGNYSWVQWDSGYTGEGTMCRPFIKGDRVYVYTGVGQLVCDTVALAPSAPLRVPDGKGGFVNKTAINEPRAARAKEKGNTGSCLMNYYCVTVPTDAINPKAYEGFDLKRNDEADAPKVLIDNMSMASNGFCFDNCLVRNVRSRGLLIKASEGAILNCTFRNIGMSCAAILYEIIWGESGVSENLRVERNLMDHTGYFYAVDRYAPIAIEGLGSRVDEDYLLYKNIRIADNVARNRTTKYAVYVNSARDIQILNNDFGSYADGEYGEHLSRAIHLNGAMNVEIAGNTYTDNGLSRTDAIVAEHIKNIFGADVTQNGIPLIADQE